MVNTMSSLAGFDPNRIAIKEHTCPRCAGAMVLVHVRPVRIGYDVRTYEGVSCSHIDRIIVATQPVKWPSERLRAHV